MQNTESALAMTSQTQRHHTHCVKIVKMQAVFAIFKHKPAWQWDNLPLMYCQSQYLSIDDEAFKKHSHEIPVLDSCGDSSANNRKN